MPPDKAEGASAPVNALPNRPETKMAPVAKGFRIQKRPIPGRFPPGTRAAPPIADPSGYVPAPRGAHTVVVYVRAAAPFMSLVSRVRKALAKTDRRAGSRRQGGAPLAARVAALKTAAEGQQQQQQDPPSQALFGQGREGDDDVVLVGTGKAIAKTVQVGAFLTRDTELVIVPRTRTLRTVDDLVAVENADGVAEDGARVRNVSCLEVGVRWKT